MTTAREARLKQVLWQTTMALNAAVRALCEQPSLLAEDDDEGGENPAVEIPEEMEDLFDVDNEVPDISARMGEMFRSSAAPPVAKPRKRVRPRSFDDDLMDTEEGEDGGFYPRRVVEVPEEDTEKSGDGEYPPVVHLSDEQIAAVQRSEDLTVRPGE